MRSLLTNALAGFVGGCTAVVALILYDWFEERLIKR